MDKIARDIKHYDFADLKARLGGDRMHLCNFCGTCIGLCPTKALVPDYENGKPVFMQEKCNKCGKCYKNCQGISVDFGRLDKAYISADSEDRHLGHYRECYLGHSTDDLVRQKGSSGGMVTQLLVYFTCL